MASSLFKKLLRRPKGATQAALSPVVGKVFNKTATPVPRTVPAKPVTILKPNVVTMPKPPALAIMGKKVELPDTSNRATRPVPEQATSAAPAKLFHRAIERVAAEPRKPDRGAANVLHGKVVTMPNGEAGGSPVTPEPLQQSLSGVFKQIAFGGGNSQVRATQITALSRNSYMNRVKSRPTVARIGQMMRRGIVQRPGSAVILKPFPSSMGALEKAQIHRRKPGTPTGVVGDRAVQTPTGHVGVLYARTVAPAVVNDRYLTQKIGGTATAAAPVPSAPSSAEAPTLQVSESVGKAYSWAPADTTAPASASVAVQNGAERWGLLLAVGVLAVILLRR